MTTEAEIKEIKERLRRLELKQGNRVHKLQVDRLEVGTAVKYDGSAIGGGSVLEVQVFS